MTAPTSVPVYTQGFGTAFTGAAFVSPNAPTSSNITGPSGPFKLSQIWLATGTNAVYILANLTASAGVISAVWGQISSGGGVLGSLTGNTGTAVPSGGSILMKGQTNQINTTASGSQVLFELASSVIFPGGFEVTTGNTVNIDSGSSWNFGNSPSFGGGFNANVGTYDFKSGVTVDFDSGSNTNFGNTPAFANGFEVAGGTVTLDASSTTNVVGGASFNFGNTPSFNNGYIISAGNLSITGAATKLIIPTTTPANNMIGRTGSLTAGTIVVSTTSITAASKVFFSPDSLGTVTAPQSYYVSARTPGVSFTIHSSDATDTSTVNYWIIN